MPTKQTDEWREARATVSQRQARGCAAQRRSTRGSLAERGRSRVERPCRHREARARRRRADHRVGSPLARQPRRGRAPRRGAQGRQARRLRRPLSLHEGRHPEPRGRAAQRHHRHERAHDRGAGPRRQGRRAGGQDARARVGRAGQGRLGRRDVLGQPAHRRPRRAHQRGRARHHRRRARRPVAEDGPRDRGPAGARRVPAHRHDRQRDGRSAQLVRGRGHARRQGSRQRGQARRPGRRQRRLRHVEGPDRQRQRPRRQPDGAGAQHRQGHHGRRQGRPVAEDHGRRQGRDPRAEEHHQRHGRSALLLRGGGHARREGSRHRGQAGRPGRRQGRVRHVEGPDRQRQRASPATSRPRCAASRR